MISAKVENLDSAFGTLDKWVDEVRGKAEKQLRVVSRYALKWLSTHSPQYTGDFAANWRAAVNSVDDAFIYHAVYQYGQTEPFKQGDRPAISYAIDRNAYLIQEAELGDYVTIANSATHDVPYAWKIESNQINFRPENYEGGRVIFRFLEHFKNMPT